MKLSATAIIPLTLASVSLAASTSRLQGPGKRGLVWPYYNNALDPGRLNDGQGTVNLIYDYETYAPMSSNGNGGLAFIGMQRCLDCDSSPIWQLPARQQDLGFATIFTLNEPDLNGINPWQAADWYKQHINPLNIKKALPAVTSSSNPGQGLDWVQQMLNACNGGCYYDYINIHWYGQSFAEFEAHVNDAHNRFPNTQIVITEFALQNPAGGQGDQLNFFRQAFAFLDSAPFVSMYFPFLASSPSLFWANDPNGAGYVGTGSTLYNDDGSISAVGQLLRNGPGLVATLDSDINTNPTWIQALFRVFGWAW
ncbi:glycosyl hydrolase catalytic core-domain-containing protein [Mycena albidolilacea]|uniref:Glycosyl hydrolase catalytic core-domain-containing protein n=1 Tax=Mycena albidolilacea TaxID=1033008 RepID=A0AAD6Z2D0_9AGAR|nr:glycosyl hydrolase catalytic core-domain-containing protein [Mycena albidolilacea]